MKLMMVLVPSECLGEVQKLVEKHDIHAYTEIPSVPGSGKTGRKLGTRAFPGTSALMLVMVEPSDSENVIRAIREYAEAAACTDGIRIFSVPVEQVF